MRSLSFYDEVGGHETFVRLVDAFYRGVADDAVLRPMYPEEDLGPAKERLTLFLEQYWGGPDTYSERARAPAAADAPRAVPRQPRRPRPLARAHARRRRRARAPARCTTPRSGTTWSAPRTRWSTRSSRQASDRPPTAALRPGIRLTAEPPTPDAGACMP